MKQLTVNLNRKCVLGFTLTEVLVTLSIIGIVAALTVPSLITNIQDQQYRAAWKKSYSSLNQATMQLTNNYNGTLKNSFSNTTVLKNTYLNYLNAAKSCDAFSSTNGCWHLANNYKTLSGNLKGVENAPGIILSDGSFMIMGYYPLCNHQVNTIYTCGNITIDVNGFKPPNTYGKDIFFTHIMENRLIPYGTQGDGKENTCSTLDTGEGCSTLYLFQ